MEESKHSILAQKLLIPGVLHNLAIKGGEIVLNEKFGIKVNKKQNWLNFQLVIYDEVPKFKQNFGQTRIEKVFVNKPEPKKDKGYEVVVEEEEDLFDSI